MELAISGVFWIFRMVYQGKSLESLEECGLGCGVM